MKSRKKRAVTKLFSSTLSLFLLLFNLALFPQDSQENRLEGLFQWSVNDYKDGKYRDVIRDMELLLSYFEEEISGKQEILKGKIHLLLGAAHERLGNRQRAGDNYRTAKTLLKSRIVDIKIEGIDFSSLKEYQRIVMEQAEHISMTMGLIEKPALNPKKKRISALLIIGGVVLVAAAVTLLTSRNEKEPGTIIEPNYDTVELGIQWVKIPAGEFLMGDNFNEGEENELPVHAVYLDDYYISRYEVTFGQYDVFCREVLTVRPDDNGWGRANRPVINVTRSSAEEFCQWLSQKTGKRIQLPTEAQWEKAARGTDQRRYPWGNSPPDCYKTNYNCDDRTHAVGSHAAGISPYDVHDMAGNVSEWCYDFYDYYFYSNSAYHNPVSNPPSNPTSWVHYVLRGGSWETGSFPTIRSCDRHFGTVYYGTGLNTTGTISNTIGFRIVWKIN